jgi:hypothetical protein
MMSKPVSVSAMAAPLLGGVLLLGAWPGTTGSPRAAAAQDPVKPPSPRANPADVASIDTILAAVYDVISGPSGTVRDWDRMRSLFVPGARLIPTRPTPGWGAEVRVLDVEDYIKASTPFFEKQGFFEREIARRTEAYGRIAHVFSTYESRHKKDDPAPFARGINSFQLLKDGDRWWVVTIYWDAERPENPLPAEYLPKS